MKEKLENEVTKAKEKLENYLSETNIDIKINERIKNGIEKINIEEKNYFKIISDASKINKTKKSMKKLIYQLMSNININYEEENDNIKYDEYYFNGLPIPKNFDIKNKTFSSFQVSWDIDEININKNEIQYIIEIRKNNEQFKIIYEGNRTTHLINNLIWNQNYDIRICSKYKEILGEWSSIQKVNTLNSIILKESKKTFQFLEKIYE